MLTVVERKGVEQCGRREILVDVLATRYVTAATAKKYKIKKESLVGLK